MHNGLLTSTNGLLTKVQATTHSLCLSVWTSMEYMGHSKDLSWEYEVVFVTSLGVVDMFITSLNFKMDIFKKIHQNMPSDSWILSSACFLLNSKLSINFLDIFWTNTKYNHSNLNDNHKHQSKNIWVVDTWPIQKLMQPACYSHFASDLPSKISHCSTVSFFFQ